MPAAGRRYTPVRRNERDDMQPESVQVTVFVWTLEPGSHLSREIIGRRVAAEAIVPASAVSETRADWGEYSPIVTIRAAERLMRARGFMPALQNRDEQYALRVVDVL
jgi:hypothetical protein